MIKMAMLSDLQSLHDIVPLSHIIFDSVLAFLIAMLLTPIYTNFAYRHKLWKHIRETAITGEKAPVFHKLHAEKHKKHIPTMAGVVTIISIVVVTLALNLSRN